MKFKFKSELISLSLYSMHNLNNVAKSPMGTATAPEPPWYTFHLFTRIQDSAAFAAGHFVWGYYEIGLIVLFCRGSHLTQSSRRCHDGADSPQRVSFPPSSIPACIELPMKLVYLSAAGQCRGRAFAGRCWPKCSFLRRSRLSAGHLVVRLR